MFNLDGIEYISSGGVSDSDIKKFEKVLNIKFGKYYKIFLKEYGCLAVEHFEFYGICVTNESIPSAIYATKKLRTLRTDLDLGLIIFYDDGSGISYGVNSHDNVWKIDFTKTIDTKESFIDFITKKIQELG